MKIARMRNIFLLCSAALLIMVSCSSVSSPNMGLIIIASITQEAPGTRTFRIGVENAGTKMETLDFTSGQRFDIEIRDLPMKSDPLLHKRPLVERGKVVWRFSKHNLFPQVLGRLELAPGESRVFEEVVWDLTGDDGAPLPPGSYWAEIYITSVPRYKHLSTVVPLTI